MKLNLIGPFIVNRPFGTEIAFAKGLRQIGVEVVEVDPNIDSGLEGAHGDADATVVFKSCVGNEERLRKIRHPIVVYQPDDARFPHIREMMLEMRKYADLFLSFDRHSTGIAKTMGYRAAEELLLTADPDLYSPSPEPIERDIDISFIGSLGDPVAHASRRRMIEIARAVGEKNGWNTVFGQSQDIPYVVDVYRRSKIVLNHATDVGQPFGMGFGLQCRHFEVGMTGTCLLSNSTPPSSLDEMICPTYSDEYDLAEKIEMIMTKTYSHNGEDELPLWSVYGKGLRAIICQKHMPHHRAAQLIDFIERNK